MRLGDAPARGHRGQPLLTPPLSGKGRSSPVGEGKPGSPSLALLRYTAAWPKWDRDRGGGQPPTKKRRSGRVTHTHMHTATQTATTLIRIHARVIDMCVGPGSLEGRIEILSRRCIPIWRGGGLSQKLCQARLLLLPCSYPPPLCLPSLQMVSTLVFV